MILGRASGILGVIAQFAAVCFWAGLAVDQLWIMFTESPEHKVAVYGVAIFINACTWAMAAATAYCIYRQVKFVQEDKLLKLWLVANAEKIRNHQPVFYRSQRVSLDTELVRHHLIFSMLILSFRMQTRWIIKGQESRFGHALAASLYTFCYGWWGFPFGIFWTPVALIKNLRGSTSVRVQDLLQPAAAKPVTFGERFESGFSRRLRGGFFIDERPAGLLPAEPTAKA